MSPEFEAGKSPSAQRPPQIPFRVRLVAAKLAGGGDRVHADRMQIAANNSSRALLLPLLATLRSREREKVVADRMRVVRGKQIKNEERAGVRSQKSFPQNKFLLRIGWGEGGRRPDEVNREIRKPRERGLTPINFPRTLAALETPKRRLLFN